MPSFNFQTDINQKALKSTLNEYGYDKNELEDNELLEQLLNQQVVDWVIRNRAITYFELAHHFGFNTEESIINFLNKPEISAQLITKMKMPPIRFSREFMDRIESTYYLAWQKQKEAEGFEQGVLSSLFDLFEFIKNLSDSEIAIIESYLRRSTLVTYLHGHSLKEFRDDLSQMETSEFEEKYQGCFNGMAENIIKPLIDAEELFLLIDRMKEENTLSVSLAEERTSFFYAPDSNKNSPADANKDLDENSSKSPKQS